MNLSMLILTATLTATPAQTPGCQNCGYAVTQDGQQVMYTTESRSGLFSNFRNRIHNHFNRPSEVITIPATPVYQQVQPIQSVVYSTQEPPTAGVVTASAQQVQMPEVAKQFQKKVGNADDYSWITGQLIYVHADGGRWVLRYASVGQEDKYGGSVVLATAAEMKNYREGDLVSVTGEVLNNGRATRHLGGPLYRVENIAMIERFDK
ncbi:MAG: hypothetical protein K2R98_17910 [Gemmataceae bacterium]|nr:hypothetical protein [Gemmataceae bacterium]